MISQQVVLTARQIALDGLDFVKDGPALMNLIRLIDQALPVQTTPAERAAAITKDLEELDRIVSWKLKARPGETDPEQREDDVLGMFVSIYFVAKRQGWKF